MGSSLLLVVFFFGTLFIPLVIAAIVTLDILYDNKKIKIQIINSPFVYLLPVAFLLHTGGTNDHWVTVAISILTVCAVAMYPPVKNFLTKRNIRVWNLADRRDSTNIYNIAEKCAYYVYLVAVLFLSFGHDSVILFVAPLILLALLAVKNVRDRKIPKDLDKKAFNSVRTHAPKFAIFCGFNEPSYYVYTVWDKYFKMVGEKFIIITQDENVAEELSKLTEVPIVFCRETQDKLGIINKSDIKAVFYPINTASNITTTQALEPLHIFIGHGDSDKAPSYRRVTAMYDYQFVAGQEAIERYENHGIHILKDKFIITGRPQVEDVQVGAGNTGTVLYAPTWQGHTNDVDYTSLYKGREIIKSLLDKNLRVVFRPHPQAYTSKTLRAVIDDIHSMLEADTVAGGPQHLYGGIAENDMTIFDCFNVADAMISDVSSVVSDFLYSEKPILLVTMCQNTAEFIKEYPIARAAYVFEKSLHGLDSTLSELLAGNDTMKADRINLKERYLSRPQKGKKYSDLFIDAVKEVIKG